eukprot:SAG11_NODE_26714_length_341_cov_2.078512_1_plen_80_part_00
MDARGPIEHVGADEHLARIENISREVKERMDLTRSYSEKHFNARVREQNEKIVEDHTYGLVTKGLPCICPETRTAHAKN